MAKGEAKCNAFVSARVGTIPTDNFYLGDINTLSSITTGDYNIAIGASALNALTTGDNNVCIGDEAGSALVTSLNNTFIGHEAGKDIIATDCVGIGWSALSGASGAASRDTAIGASAGANLTDGDDNVFLGYGSGAALTTGSSNVFLGAYAGFYHTDESDILIIDNEQRADKATEISTALIYGYFENHASGPAVVINGTVASDKHTITTTAATGLHIDHTSTDAARFFLEKTGGTAGGVMYQGGRTAVLYYDSLGSYIFRTAHYADMQNGVPGNNDITTLTLAANGDLTGTGDITGFGSITSVGEIRSNNGFNIDGVAGTDTTFLDGSKASKTVTVIGGIITSVA